MSIIILEGCDAVGKTTFAKTISEKLNFNIVKGSSFEISELGRDKMFEYMMSLMSKDNIVIDRFVHSNLVYGSLFNYPQLSIEQYQKLIKKINDKALLVYLYADSDAIKKRINSRGDDRINVSHIDKILSSYDNVFMNNKFKPRTLLSIDTTGFHLDIGMSFIVDKSK